MKEEMEEENRSGIGKDRIRHPFKAPEGYFDRLNNEIHHRIERAGESRPFFIPFKTAWKVVPALAVAVIVIMLVLQKDGHENDRNQYISLNYDELYASGLVAFDETTLTEYIDFAADSSTAEETYIIEGLNEEVLINEL